MTDNTDDKKAKAGKALTEDQITSKKIDRRTMLRSAGLVGLGAGTLGVSGCVVVPVGSGITDVDNGNITDPVGGGRGSRRGYYTGITDRDYGGNITDPGGQGRG